VKETGRVLAVSGTTVTLAPDASSACFGCMNRECRQKRGILVAENKTGFPLSAGQQVETEYPLKTALAQGLPLLALPFLAFAAAYLASGLLVPVPGEGVRAAIGAAGLFAAGTALFLYRSRNPHKSRPQVIKIIGP
jgi:positive regulator of sigma E activity